MVTIDALPPLATPAQLEAWTKGKIKAGDARVPDALAAVSRSIRNRCGWHVAPAVEGHQLVLDGPGGTVLSLPSMKIKTLTTVKDDGAALDPAPGADLRVSKGTGLVKKRSGGRWSGEYGSIEVTMDHGHDKAEDLAGVCLSIAARGLASPMGATREQAGALSVNWAMAAQGVSGGIIPMSGELAIVDAYRLTGWS